MHVSTFEVASSVMSEHNRIREKNNTSCSPRIIYHSSVPWKSESKGFRTRKIPSTQTHAIRHELCERDVLTYITRAEIVRIGKVVQILGTRSTHMNPHIQSDVECVQEYSWPASPSRSRTGRLTSLVRITSIWG